MRIEDIKTFDQARQLHAFLRNVYGPWIQHYHGFGCSCGGYPADSKYRGTWWFRRTLDDSCGVEAFSEEDKLIQDEKIKLDGFCITEANGNLAYAQSSVIANQIADKIKERLAAPSPMRTLFPVTLLSEKEETK